MIAYVTWFTEQGRQIADKISGMPLHITYGQCCESYGGRIVPGRLAIRAREGRTMHEWLSEAFAKGLPVIIIGAAGIAVRTIAPFVTNKIADSPVIVIDDAGRYVIPVLAGHLGGANELASNIAARLTDTDCKAQPVITTSTDVNNAFAIDVFARRNGLRVCNADGIRKVSGRAVSGSTIIIAIDRQSGGCMEECTIEDSAENGGAVIPDMVRITDWEKGSSAGHVDVLITNDADEEKVSLYKQKAGLILAPKTDVLGIGCKKNKEYDDIRRRIEEACAVGLIREDNICALASIDIKADEAGLLEAAQVMRVPFVVFTAEELRKVPGDYTPSQFVENTTGVDNVCERAAVAASGGCRLAVRKQAGNGITLAVAKRRSIKLVF